MFIGSSLNRFSSRTGSLSIFLNIFSLSLAVVACYNVFARLPYHVLPYSSLLNAALYTSTLNSGRIFLDPPFSRYLGLIVLQATVWRWVLLNSLLIYSLGTQRWVRGRACLSWKPGLCSLFWDATKCHKSRSLPSSQGCITLLWFLASCTMASLGNSSSPPRFQGDI